MPICEDIWSSEVIECLEESGAEMLLVPNGSPFALGKFDVRVQHCVARIKESGLPLAYVNQIGGQDELVFDGGSFVLNANAERHSPMYCRVTARRVSRLHCLLSDISCFFALMRCPGIGVTEVHAMSRVPTHV